VKFILLTLLCSTLSFGYNLWSDTLGLSAYMEHDYRKALEQIESDTGFSDSAFHHLKLARTALAVGDTQRSILHLKTIYKFNDTFAPHALELLGDIFYNRCQLDQALSSYRTARNFSLPQRYHYHLTEKMAELIDNEHLDPREYQWVYEGVFPLPRPAAPDSAKVDRWNKNNTLKDSVEAFLQTASRNDTCQLFHRYNWLEIDKGLLPVEHWYSLSRGAYLCNDYDRASDLLHRALSFDEFDTKIDRKQYIWYRAFLNYGLKNYNKTIYWLKKYNSSYEPQSIGVMTIARSYRALGKSALAAHWYNRHVEIFPNHERTHDILWYRAWSREDRHDYQQAYEYHRHLYKQFPRAKRSDDAHFRSGLCLVKMEKYSEAADVFRTILRTRPQSPFVPATQYWLGKCLLELHQPDSARALFSTIAKSHPTDYYAFRSTERLFILGDTLSQPHLFTAGGVSAARDWIDSLGTALQTMNTRRLDAADTLALIIGSKLAWIGDYTAAAAYLEPVEQSFSHLLGLQFDLARLYLDAGLDAFSYRIARQFLWLLPEEARIQQPLELYQLMYPRAYGYWVRKYSRTFSVDEHLVWAVMRQESTFEPHIISSAGATGLMQLMPYTARSVASRLNLQYEIDSLYSPGYNIQLGVAYLQEVLEQFDQNMVNAIASYNGGPHNVKKWVRLNKDDSYDMFIEDIGFSETRHYVKKVLANYWTYKAITDYTAQQTQRTDVPQETR